MRVCGTCALYCVSLKNVEIDHRTKMETKYGILFHFEKYSWYFISVMCKLSPFK